MKIVVFNNGALSFVELEMKADGFVTFGTDLDNPDFAAIAGPLGMLRQRVEHPATWTTRCGTPSPTTGAALVDVRTARQELSLPPKLTFGQIKGFTLYATRTILSGGGDELVDLATENLPLGR